MRSESSKYLSRGSEEPLDTTGVLLDEAQAADMLTKRQPVDFRAMFGNTRPVEIEIGTGKGTFLLARASARPEINFLGMEWARAYCLYSADRFRRHGLANVRMLRTDAGPFFKHCLPDSSVWRIHIYFPDPWPKRRHHRRRLFQPDFLNQARRVLRPGGQLLIVTDHLDYFYQIRRVLQDAPAFARIAFPQMTDAEGHITGTNFERKYIAQGRPFYSAARMKFVE